MKLLGVNGKLLRIVKCMYTKIKCCVKGHKGLTEFFLALLGVQQGAILSPYLFALYLNDLPDILKMYNPDGGIIMDYQCYVIDVCSMMYIGNYRGFTITLDLM